MTFSPLPLPEKQVPLSEIALILGLISSAVVGVEKTLSGYKKILRVEYQVERLTEIVERIESKWDAQTR